VGDEITTLPSNEKAHVKSIHVADKDVQKADAGQPVTIQLDREVDVSRGCVLSVDSKAKVASTVTATLLWMDDVELENGKNFFVKLGTKLIPGNVTKIVHTIDVNTGEEKLTERLRKNEIAVCQLSFADRIVVDEFKHHKTLGELILIDRVTNMTSACGVVTEISEDEGQTGIQKVDREARSNLKGQRAITVEFAIRENGFTMEMVERVERELSNEGRHTYLYAPKAGDPVEEVVKHLNAAGLVVLLANQDGVDLSAFATDRTYYSNWQKEDTSVEDAVKYVRQVSSIVFGVGEGEFI
jgi:sulfate adenylyltransferase subunit 1